MFPACCFGANVTLFPGPFGFPLGPSLPSRRAGDFNAENPLPRPFVALTVALPFLAPCQDFFGSLQIDAAEWTRHREAHPGKTPDFPLLPASGYF
jgi:hypothetical protein